MNYSVLTVKKCASPEALKLTIQPMKPCLKDQIKSLHKLLLKLMFHT